MIPRNQVLTTAPLANVVLTQLVHRTAFADYKAGIAHNVRDFDRLRKKEVIEAVTIIQVYLQFPSWNRKSDVSRLLH